MMWSKVLAHLAPSAKGGSCFVYQGTVGGYWRTTRGGRKWVRQCNGYELAETDDVGLCPRSVRCCRVSVVCAHSMGTHTTGKQARVDLG